MPSRLRIWRCSLVSLVVKTTGGFVPTSSVCRCTLSKTTITISRGTVGYRQARPSGYNGKLATPRRSIARRSSRSNKDSTKSAKKYMQSKA